MSMQRRLTRGEQRLIALVGRGDQTLRDVPLTPRELETLATVLDSAAAEYQASAQTHSAKDIDAVIADHDHVADLSMLRDRLRSHYEQDPDQ